MSNSRLPLKNNYNFRAPGKTSRKTSSHELVLIAVAQPTHRQNHISSFHLKEATTARIERTKDVGQTEATHSKRRPRQPQRQPRRSQLHNKPHRHHHHHPAGVPHNSRHNHISYLSHFYAHHKERDPLRLRPARLPGFPALFALSNLAIWP